jgi:hypothetical protein
VNSLIHCKYRAAACVAGRAPCIAQSRSHRGQIAPSLQGVGYGQSNTVTERWSLGDPNGERVPETAVSNCNKIHEKQPGPTYISATQGSGFDQSSYRPSASWPIDSYPGQGRQVRTLACAANIWTEEANRSAHQRRASTDGGIMPSSSVLGLNRILYTIPSSAAKSVGTAHLRFGPQSLTIVICGSTQAEQFY